MWGSRRFCGGWLVQGVKRVAWGSTKVYVRVL